MKFIFIFALITVFIVPLGYSKGSSNHKVRINGRIDYQSNDNDFDNSGVADNNAFRLAYGRITSTGNIKEDINYKLELKLAGNKFVYNANDNDSRLVSQVWMQHHFSKNFSLRMGKQYNSFGGMELQPSPQNVYKYSLAHSGLDYFVYGVAGIYKLENHNFKLLVSNADRSETGTAPSTAATQNTVATGLLWNGVFSKNYKTAVSYHAKPTEGDVIHKYLFLGFKIDFDKWYVEIDHSTKTKENETTADKEDVDTSDIVKFAYVGNKFRPFVKYIVDESKVSDEKEYGQTSTILGLNYHPYADDDFRYHVAIVNSNKDFEDSSTTDYSTSSIIAGLRFNFFALD